jgi:co-chaperonin GroES (HSP10)
MTSTAINDTGVRPIQDQVLVRRDEPEKQTRGGLHLPDGSWDWPVCGTVLAIGPQVTGLAVGERVLFRSRGSTALIPDTREPDQPASWERVVVLRTGEARCTTTSALTGPRAPTDGRDLLGIIEES